MILNLLSFLAFVLYTAGSVAQYAKFFGKHIIIKPHLIITTLLALLLHGYVLYRFIDTPFGQNLNTSTMVSLVAWLITLFTVLASIRAPIENLMLLILPVSAISIPMMNVYSIPNFFQTGQNLNHLFHILISIAAVSLLGMAGLQATLLYLQNQSLRNKSIQGLIRFLPPMETMETHLFQIVGVGFVLLSISLVSTWTFVDGLYTASRLHKVILSWLAWCFFAILLVGRKQAGWRGLTAVRWTLTGTMILIVAYFSSKLILLTYTQSD